MPEPDELGPAVTPARPVVVGVFQQSSMSGRGTVGWSPGASVSLPVGTVSDRVMLVLAAPDGSPPTG